MDCPRGLHPEVPARLPGTRGAGPAARLPGTLGAGPAARRPRGRPGCPAARSAAEVREASVGLGGCGLTFFVENDTRERFIAQRAEPLRYAQNVRNRVGELAIFTLRDHFFCPFIMCF